MDATYIAVDCGDTRALGCGLWAVGWKVEGGCATAVAVRWRENSRIWVEIGKSELLAEMDAYWYCQTVRRR